MSLKAKQHSFNAQFTHAPKTKGCVSFTKYIILFISLLFSLNGFAAGDILHCEKFHTWERYHNLHHQIKKNPYIIKNIHLVYNLAKVTLCLGETEEGIDHLQKASDNGHIPATSLLGDYYKTDYTFSSSERTNNLENLNKAIYYYKKATQMIEALPNYPKGSTNDMAYIEYASPFSYYVFTGLTFLYFRGYAIAFENILNGNEEEEIFYDDTLKVLSKMGEAAINCLNRPALDIWKEKKEIIYESQQMECNAYLEFVEAAYILEQQRLEADDNCQVPLKECTEHKKIVDKIVHLAKDMNRQMDSASEKVNSIF